MRLIAYISCATLERQWTPFNVEAVGIVWVIKRLRGYLYGTKFRTFTDNKVAERIGKVGDHNVRAQRWLWFLTVFDYTLEYPKSITNGNTISCLVCQSLPPNTTALDPAATTPWKMAEASSSGPAASHPFRFDPRCCLAWAGAPP